MTRSGASLAALLFAVSGAALGQEATPPAQPNAPPGSNAASEQPVNNPKQVDEGQQMTLPSVGNAGRSAAPTMVFECGKRPGECTDPVKPGDGLVPPISRTP